MINLKIQTNWPYTIREEKNMIVINVNNHDRFYPKNCLIEFIGNRIYVNGKLNNDLLEDE